MVELLAPGAALALQTAPLTYPEIGATRGPLPAGYHHQHVSARVGTGRAAFEAAAETLLTWGMHEGAGLTARVSDRRVRTGTVAELRLGLGPLGLRIPVRVLEVVEDEQRRGFVYGTLPGHPERGEESFAVELAADGAVFFDLVAFSRGGRWFTVLGAPVARAGQYLVTERYLDAVRTAAQDAGPG
ncbi:Uncharacterized protein, UPF0548 family [Friedmanniella luteola]|uniref:Uncharacterized protein, UPF0548 family n=1 Tax=Friedmanniella luteola TaxID=546871 RepID=A0A1H1TXI3_9ACTN|nr:DUF1990 domain-containing protein [Friedmanniella luteola]SDS64676.1 Uncharacterized protein, UPF0548 family [Friedmanniella luteola]